MGVSEWDEYVPPGPVRKRKAKWVFCTQQSARVHVSDIVDSRTGHNVRTREVRICVRPWSAHLGSHLCLETKRDIGSKKSECVVSIRAKLVGEIVWRRAGLDGINSTLSTLAVHDKRVGGWTAW